jgi:hypothetical protein
VVTLSVLSITIDRVIVKMYNISSTYWPFDKISRNELPRIIYFVVREILFH